MSLSAAEEIELLTLLEAEAREIFPATGPFRRELYPKHLEFFRAGKNYRERLMIAANRCGKTLAACYEVVCHLTGIYPAWWEGRRFARAIRCWVAGTHSKKVKESVQEILCGPVGAWGSGLLPRETIRRLTRASGSVPDLLDTVWVRHVSGGWSTLTFKTYEQGREAFEASQVDVVFEDEEPPLQIHAECLLRTMDTSGTGAENGLVLTTFTPLEGLSDTVLHFLPDGQIPDSPVVDGRYIVNASWDDVPHLDAATKAELLAAIPAYQRDARTRGIPVLAAGVIYPVPEDTYLVDPVVLAPHWKRAYGMDVGWNRTAALWGAYDQDSDTWYLYSEHYHSHAEPSVHAAGIRGRGDWIPGVIDPASRGRSQVDGRQLLEDYQQLGLQLTPAVAAVEAGIYQVLDRLATGRLKVFKTLTNFRTEIRLYRRDEKGHIIKLNDHLMDCCKYLINSGLEVARQETPRRRAPQGVPLAGTAHGWMG